MAKKQKKGIIKRMIDKLDKNLVKESKKECSCDSKASANKNNKKACKDDDEDCGCCN
ncbi:MAG: hypothetical protein NT001_07785 [Candidatus Woesearchaeota archaeon]|nr:hypothetical protein [Candidatus Woesearchaeota archaeon]